MRNVMGLESKGQMAMNVWMREYPPAFRHFSYSVTCDTILYVRQ